MKKNSLTNYIMIMYGISMNNLGIKIRELRESKGLSYNDLAKISGVSNRMVSKIESGQNCSIEILTKIAGALGMPPAYFLM